MIESIEDFKKVEMDVGNITNGIDSPNILSVDSTTAIVTTPDGVQADSEEDKESVKAKEEKDKKEVEKKDKKEVEEIENEEEEVVTPLPTESKPVEKRIGELTKKWRTAERTAAYEKEKRFEAEQKLKELQAKVPLDGHPEKEDFDDEDEYIAALVAWEVANALKSKQSVEKEVQEEVTERSNVEAVYNEVDEVIEKGSAKHSDYVAVVLDDNLAVSAEMLEVILDCDDSEDVLYYLGKNHDEAADIFEMGSVRMIRAITKIEAQLKAKAAEASQLAAEKVKTEKEEKLKRKVTKVPEPIVPPTTDGVMDKDPSDMSYKEFKLWRERSKKR